MKIKLLELFSGIGGFAKGLTDAGHEITKHYFSEVDKHAIANYKYNFKNAEYVGSVVNVRGAELERPNIITFGSPCQDFSLAGNRLGMDGQRSVLILHAIRLVAELKPDFFLWENVKGAFSSNNGEDFWGIIKAFANIGGYRLEWQLLNTAWFLPQNRERIYLVGHLATAGRSFKGVFPIGEATKNNYESEQIIVANLYNSTSQDGKVFSVLGTSQTLSAGHGNVPKILQLSNSKESGGVQPYQQNRVYDDSGIIPALMSDMSCGAHAILQKSHGYNEGGKKEICPTITKNSFEHNNHVIVAQRGRGDKGEIEQQLEPRYDGITNTLTSVQKDNLVFLTEPQHKHGDDRTYTDIAPAVQERYGTGGDNIPYVNNIRRLTEIECERLQGYPDNWTEFGDYDGVIKKIPKTQRYKLCGNAVTTNVVCEIGKRLIKNYSNQ